MYTSIFKLFKIGIGPSSSHTIGPLIASNYFINELKLSRIKINSLKIQIYGSLAYTGKGHGTDLGILAGLMGYTPQNIKIDDIRSLSNKVKASKELAIPSFKYSINFDFEKDIVLNFKNKKNHKHTNAIEFKGYMNNKLLKSKLYYSIGGGFVTDGNKKINKPIAVPNDFKSAKDLLQICKTKNKYIYELIIENEKELQDTTNEKLTNNILHIWKTMNKSIYNGMQSHGILGGNLKIKRRANSLYKKLIKNKKSYDPLDVLDWVNVFAIAVSEENASFGKIVTAPTNGASGIIPAVIKYYIEFCKDSSNNGIVRFLLTASAVGTLYKENASISGAETGCQGEIGVACSMAAGGLTAALNGTNEQVENAAEIAMEHNLGLTCDPINGLVQIPCIERNAMGAIKAINASRISLNGSGQHKVSLDEVMKTMWETGKNMSSIYKETSKGGLAVNVSEC